MMWRPVNFFSIQLDESIDAVDTAQLAISVKMVFDDFSTKEEFLKNFPLTARTQGKDIFSLFKKFAIENKLPLKKLSSITTDGARAMTGKENGFIGLCRKDPLFPKFIAYHCLIHQEMLFAKTINFNHSMSIVTKIINSIKAKVTQHRLFKLFLENENTEFKDFFIVRWLTRGKVLERFINLLPQVKEFVASRNEVYKELENKNWLLDLGFLVDMTMKFNELILKLQGKNSHIADMISAVNSFKCKLGLLKVHLLKNSLSHFQNVKRIIENLNLSVDEFDITSYIKTIDTLIIEFSSRFQDFLPLESVILFFVNPFNVHEPDLPSKILNYFDVTNMQDLEMEIINLQNNIVLKSHYVDKSIRNDEVHFWLNGYVNKQNCRIWSEANPQVYVETPLHPEKLTVWCALWAGGILLQKR
ncbi:general transcription factor II-I repeat domain-containing protein 2 [Trichonephila clavipes]|uniref:General transcription factor II-I repeat domain-containing protein 2 n=1 Tax=Trichonephila clavipes TaxID=2585209 RepID=A0A8X7BMD2_TRICX|nr:general transcription factor II-I repeat domain-containing protein 2 [Trichonephila clavipes]